MKEHLPRNWRAHIHCFTSSPDLAKRLLAEWPNLFIGFTGVITFETATDVRRVAELTPLDRLLLETDGPYMTPSPYR
jgi:TatD DNase family protein